MTERLPSPEIPAEIRERIAYHGEQAAYHRGQRRELNRSYTSLETWKDLRETFDLTTDEHLRSLTPGSLVPDAYGAERLVMSRSTGTTGSPKEVYWHPADIEANVDALVDAFDDTAVPRDARWVATATPNPVLRETLRGVATRFGGTVDIVQLDPEPIKRALADGDDERIAEALSGPAERVVDAIEESEAAVYEDIPPLMAHVGRMLPGSVRRDVDQLLIGGVGTTADVVRHLTETAFPGAGLAGWYGDYLNGFSPMQAAATLSYRPPYPDVRFDVVDPENPAELVAPGERGAVVSHTVRRGFFVPNRWTGDSARRVTIGGTDGVAAVRRTDAEPPSTSGNV